MSFLKFILSVGDYSVSLYDSVLMNMWLNSGMKDFYKETIDNDIFLKWEFESSLSRETGGFTLRPILAEATLKIPALTFQYLSDSPALSNLS